MLPGELFFQENAAPKHGSDAVSGDDGSGNGCMSRIGESEDVRKLSRRLADSTQVFRTLLLGEELVPFDEFYIEEA